MSVTAKPYYKSTSQPSKSEITRARHTCNITLSASVICKYNKLVYFTNLIVKCFDVVIFDALILFFLQIPSHRHAEMYEGVFLFRGRLGEQPRRLYLFGQGSYDGKHEAVLNV